MKAVLAEFKFTLTPVIPNVQPNKHIVYQALNLLLPFFSSNHLGDIRPHHLELALSVCKLQYDAIILKYINNH